jgi:hypothetical protein
MPFHIFHAQPTFALHRHRGVAIDYEQVDLDALAPMTEFEARIDLIDIQPLATKEFDHRGLDHRLDELAQAVAQIAKAAREVVEAREDFAHLRFGFLELTIGFLALDGEFSNERFDVVPTHLGGGGAHRRLSQEMTSL